MLDAGLTIVKRLVSLAQVGNATRKAAMFVASDTDATVQAAIQKTMPLEDSAQKKGFFARIASSAMDIAKKLYIPQMVDFFLGQSTCRLIALASTLFLCATGPFSLPIAATIMCISLAAVGISVAIDCEKLYKLRNDQLSNSILKDLQNCLARNPHELEQFEAKLQALGLQKAEQESVKTRTDSFLKAMGRTLKQCFAEESCALALSIITANPIAIFTNGFISSCRYLYNSKLDQSLREDQLSMRTSSDQLKSQLNITTRDKAISVDQLLDVYHSIIPKQEQNPNYIEITALGAATSVLRDGFSGEKSFSTFVANCNPYNVNAQPKERGIQSERVTSTEKAAAPSITKKWVTEVETYEKKENSIEAAATSDHLARRHSR